MSLHQTRWEAVVRERVESGGNGRTGGQQVHSRDRGDGWITKGGEGRSGEDCERVEEAGKSGSKVTVGPADEAGGAGRETG